jgi:hypothetical protein
MRPKPNWTSGPSRWRREELPIVIYIGDSRKHQKEWRFIEIMNVILFFFCRHSSKIPANSFPEAVFCGSGLVSSALAFGLLTWAGKIVRESSSQVGFIVAMSARNFSSFLRSNGVVQPTNSEVTAGICL